jgi:hypothetical protein
MAGWRGEPRARNFKLHRYPDKEPLAPRHVTMGCGRGAWFFCSLPTVYCLLLTAWFLVASHRGRPCGPPPQLTISLQAFQAIAQLNQLSERHRASKEC